MSADKHKDPEFGDIPELDDIVDDSGPEPKIPPNLDLFGGESPDLEEIRNALQARIADEVDALLADVRTELEQLLSERLEARLRERLPALIDDVLGRD